MMLRGWLCVGIALAAFAGTPREASTGGRGIRTEADGTFSFAVHERLTYVVNPSYRDAGSGRSTAASTPPFEVAATQLPITIVLTPR